MVRRGEEIVLLARTKHENGRMLPATIVRTRAVHVFLNGRVMTNGAGTLHPENEGITWATLEHEAAFRAALALGA